MVRTTYEQCEEYALFFLQYYHIRLSSHWVAVEEQPMRLMSCCWWFIGRPMQGDKREQGVTAWLPIGSASCDWINPTGSIPKHLGNDFAVAARFRLQATLAHSISPTSKSKQHLSSVGSLDWIENCGVGFCCSCCGLWCAEHHIAYLILRRIHDILRMRL